MIGHKSFPEYVQYLLRYPEYRVLDAAVPFSGVPLIHKGTLCLAGLISYV